MKLKVEKLLGKKEKYLIYSVVLVAALAFVSESSNKYYVFAIITTFVLGLVGSVIVQTPNVKRQNALFTLLLPLHLIAGTILSLTYFPNLGNLIKIAALVSVGVVAYAVSLVNNIFLVVEEREKVMPLYRVAVTWSQILLITIAIPFFSGVFKMPYNSIIQAVIVGLSSFIFTIYLIWTQDFDEDVRKVTSIEKVISAFQVMFMVTASSLTVAFVPTESFLRALFISAILMASLGYLQSHFKNTVTKRLLVEYSVITFIFLLFVLVFRA